MRPRATLASASAARHPDTGASETARLLAAISSELAPRGFEFRPIEPADEAFLFRIYASTREKELSQTAWVEEAKTAFLRMQFAAQHAHYRAHYVDSSFSVVSLADAPVGRLYLARLRDALRIVDIALLPEWRGQGLGTSLLAAILQEGTREGIAVSIHVEHINPALRLYARLGFRQVADRGVYYLMEKAPDAGRAPE
jgi:ribosomal protein S18 acetylase RimI-like enzyme